MRQAILALICMTLGILAPGQRADAAGPEETVTWIYSSLPSLAAPEDKGLAYFRAPERRGDYFSRRMVAFLDANDSYRGDMMTACIDFALDIPGQDFDAAEIARTLTVTSTGDDARRAVTASFRNFGALVRMTYVFVVEDGFWRIDDIESPEWRLSDIPCTARGTAEAERIADAGDGGVAYTGGEAAYCYRTAGDQLSLRVTDSGSAQFAFESVQANGHICSGEGEARWTGAGWVHEATLDGGFCRIEFLVTAEQGLRLTDRDWTCKPTLCGARAVIDGLTFPRASQVDCAMLGG